MTSEEMERAIEFLLKSQATSEARIEQVNKNLGERIAQTNEQLAQTSQRLNEYADTQMEFIRVMTTTWESQGLFNNSMRTAYRKLARKVDKLIDATGGSGGE